MRTAFSKVLGIAALAIALGSAGTASAVPILTQFNINASGAFVADTGDITTATTISTGAPNNVGFIQLDNTGLVNGQIINLLTSPLGVMVGDTFTKTWTTPLGTFSESLTVTSRTAGANSLGILATGTLSQIAGAGFDPVPVFYSASYTQNQGPGTQINGSFNNSTTPPNIVPEPATLALIGLGLAGISFLRRRNQ